MDPNNHQYPSSDLAPSSGLRSDKYSPYNSEHLNFSYAVFKYINDILMEEDIDDKICMLQDCLALQATEKSFYEVLVQKKYPPSPDHCSLCVEQNDNSLDENIIWTSSLACNNSYTATNNFVESNSIFDQTDSVIDCHESSLPIPNLQREIQTSGPSRGGPYADGTASALKNSTIQNLVLQNPVVADVEMEGSYYSRGRKNHHHTDGNYLEEGRNNKHSVRSLEESEQSDLFDEVMNPKGGNYNTMECTLFEVARNGAGLKFPCNEKKKWSDSRILWMMKRANTTELVDLWSGLTKCAQAVANYDQRRASVLLKQIRQNSSPFGDGTQRLAHYFANGLEARLAGTGTPFYSPAYICRTSVADILKAYLVYVSASPFRKVSNVLTNQTIGKLAEKATRLHIIDFGISYGFQWPCFIKRESYRPGGPPKIHITGIELPQPGFRPAERVEETGRRLKKVSDRCNVAFEFNAIAQKWETIQPEDLKIDRDEMVVVTCMHRLNDLPDDTVVLNSPRDAVLNLIKRINPDLFVHGVCNGTYNSPFFFSRFREALFHFSGLFDMFEATVPSEDEGRMIFEREVLGRNAINVIACEGLERTDNPETYKQWQARTLRAGFRQLPLDRKLLKRVRKLVEADYHKDFLIDENGKWMLQGWKGKIVHALSFWKPVQE